MPDKGKETERCEGEGDREVDPPASSTWSDTSEEEEEEKPKVSSCIPSISHGLASPSLLLRIALISCDYCVRDAVSKCFTCSNYASFVEGQQMVASYVASCFIHDTRARVLLKR